VNYGLVQPPRVGGKRIQLTRFYRERPLNDPKNRINLAAYHTRRPVKIELLLANSRLFFGRMFYSTFPPPHIVAEDSKTGTCFNV
jgi:hypothetical protein